MTLAWVDGNLFDEPVEWVPEEGCVAPASLGPKHLNNTLVNLAEKVAETFGWEIPLEVELIRDKGAGQFEYSDRREVKEFITQGLARLEVPMKLTWSADMDLYIEEA